MTKRRNAIPSRIVIRQLIRAWLDAAWRVCAHARPRPSGQHACARRRSCVVWCTHTWGVPVPLSHCSQLAARGAHTYISRPPPHLPHPPHPCRRHHSASLVLISGGAAASASTHLIGRLAAACICSLPRMHARARAHVHRITHART